MVSQDLNIALEVEYHILIRIVGILWQTTPYGRSAVSENVDSLDMLCYGVLLHVLCRYKPNGTLCLTSVLVLHIALHMLLLEYTTITSVKHKDEYTVTHFN